MCINGLRRLWLRGRLLLLAVLLAAGFAPAAASAHTAKTDGTIQVLLHTDPDDDPVSGTRTAYEFIFKDSTNRFSLASCGCSLTISLGNKTMHTASLIAIDALHSKGVYTFPRPATYTLRINGQPKVSEAFQPFALAYSVQIGSKAPKAQTKTLSPMVWAGMGVAVALLLVAAVFFAKRKRS